MSQPKPSLLTSGRTAVDADVVVVGSGGAGLTAAAAADRAGARVVLVTKGRAGLANATAYAAGKFTVSPPVEARDDVAGVSRQDGRLTPEEHFDLSFRAGRGLSDPDLLDELCRKGAEAIETLQRDFGVKVDWRRGGCSVARYGQPPLLGGVGLTKPLLAHLRRAGVFILEDTVVSGIVQADGPGRGEVLGVLGLRTGTEAAAHMVEIHAPAVVVATGGGGAIYGRTDNPPRMTGDGYSLLARAGAALEDMEFVQFYPLGVAEPGLRPRFIGAEILDFVRLGDEAGRDPLAGKFSEWGVASGAETNLYARDKAAVHLARYIGAGHELYLHTEELDPAKAPKWVVGQLAGSLPRSFDPFSRPVRVAPLQHYFCGGALISPRGEVRNADKEALPGLYACGESTGGVDGANRVGGNALVNIVVFGLASGRAAAEYALGPGRGIALSRGGAAGSAGATSPWEAASHDLSDRLSAWVGRLGCHPAGSAADPPAAFRERLHAICDRLLGPNRSDGRLAEARAELARLGEDLGTLSARTPADLLLALELRFAVETASFVAAAALARTESRGSHFREDFPAEDESWAAPVTVTLLPSGPEARRGLPRQGCRRRSRS